ncbi:ABC transporter permease [Larkinella harenae]
MEDELQGDMLEMYVYWLKTVGLKRARWRYGLAVLRLIRPFTESTAKQSNDYSQPLILQPAMISNYLKIAWRNLAKNKTFSAINIGGLAVGMAVAMLIGLWLWDELSFNVYHQNYSRIAQVYHRNVSNGEVRTGGYSPVPLGDELRRAYPDDFQYVVMSSWTNKHILAYGDKKFSKTGNYLSADAPNMLTLKMLKGSRAGLTEPASIFLSESVATALFGSVDPLGKIVKIDNKLTVKVTGVYEDLPDNTQFHDMLFIAPWDLFVSSEDWVRQLKTNWQDHSFQILVQLAPNANLDAVTAKIKRIKATHSPEELAFKPETFLHPMSRWHLYSDWDKQGNPGGRIQYVWLFGIIGVFVLLLACINFMNLSTARSEKRAKEVGIRKAIGSVRTQLIGQFLGESLLVVVIAFGLSLAGMILVLPLFNEVANKQLVIPWCNPVFWLLGLGFTLFTGLMAGSYPAIFLSSFQPISVLKSSFRVGHLAAIPRKVLVVVQFTASVTLIIGTILVFQQIEHAKNRPIGYDRNGLITVPINTPELRGRYSALRGELLQTGAVVDMSTASSSATYLDYRSGGFEWPGKDPTFKDNFGVTAVTHDFGKTVGWKFKEGRDFSRQFSTDSSGMVLNQTAVRYMGLKNPVGKTVTWRNRSFQVLGVISDMVMESPFDPVKPSVFLLNYDWANAINIKLDPTLSASESLERIALVFRRFNPGSPFEFKFSDREYAAKFATEERVGKLASVFALLAILISCLGLFGLASFMAEQRTKEIGVRKVLGASVLNLWGLLSKEFVVLVLIAFLLATPVAYYVLSSWLQKFEYRTELSWWIFATTGVGAIVITLMTVSYQSIKAALLNPVKSLRSE